jgi:hypothetical protein
MPKSPALPFVAAASRGMRDRVSTPLMIRESVLEQ